MPELPEVETIKNQLLSALQNKTIQNITILKPKAFIGDPLYLINATINGARRFAKLMVIDTDSPYSLAIHLKMTGQLLFISSTVGSPDDLLDSLPNTHTRVVITFKSGEILYFNDQRMFGWIKVVSSTTLEDLTRHLGPDALNNLTIKHFKTVLATTKRPIKTVLLDQTRMGGIGNIYANDSLFLSKIHPLTPGNKLTIAQIQLLFKNIRKVLIDGINYRGASKNHFRDIYGQKGEVQNHFWVYDREGEKCKRCNTLIKKMTLGGRGTFYCPVCQHID